MVMLIAGGRLPNERFVDAERAQVIGSYGSPTNFRRNVIPVVQELRAHAVDNLVRPSPERIIDKARRDSTTYRHKSVPCIPNVGIRSIVRQIPVRIVLQRDSRERGLLVSRIIRC